MNDKLDDLWNSTHLYNCILYILCKNVSPGQPYGTCVSDKILLKPVSNHKKMDLRETA